MSFWNRLLRRKVSPTVFLGDVDMHLEWNVLSALCDGFGYDWRGNPAPEVLQRHFADALGLPVYDRGKSELAGNQLFHLAITDLRHGHLGALRAGDYWIPVALRPSVTVQGYLVDLETGHVLAEARQTQKPGWVRYRNPPLLAWSLIVQGDAAGDALDPPMCETAAIKVLMKLKKIAKQQAKLRRSAKTLPS